MTGRAACLVVVGVVAVVCSSPSTGAGHAVGSPSPSTAVYLGSLGSSGCTHAAAFHEWQPPQGGFPEVGLDTSRGSLWTLFFNPVPPAAGKEIKVVWRMTGSGDFTFRISDTDGNTIPLTWGPEVHSGSNWDHPGDEVGTGFTFPHAGCWNIHVARSDVSGDLWLEVAV